MAAPQAPPELSPETAGRLAEFAKACKAATRIVSMYPGHASGDSGCARPYWGGHPPGDHGRPVHDHRAARRAPGQWPGPARAGVVGHGARGDAPSAADRRDDPVRSARQRRLARVPVAAGEDARGRPRNRRRGQGLGRDRQQVDPAHGDRLRRSAARARRQRRKRDLGSHPHRAQGRARPAGIRRRTGHHLEHDGAG